MHDFRTEHDSFADEYESRKNVWCKSTIKNNKILKINLIKLITFSVKGMIKEHKKTGTKKIDRRKKRNLGFLSPGKNPVYFLCSTERNWHVIKRAGSDVTQVTAWGTFWIKTL